MVLHEEKADTPFLQVVNHSPMFENHDDSVCVGPWLGTNIRGDTVMLTTHIRTY